MRACLTCSLALAGSSCEGEPGFSVPPVVGTTDRIEYRSESSLDSCPSAPARVQADLEAVEALLKVPGPARLRYSRYDNQDNLNANCGAEVEGCAWGSQIFSLKHVHRHETVHAVLPTRRPPELFAEGVAVAFSYGLMKPSTPWPAWREVLTGHTRELYTHAGAFVTYLAVAYGIDRFMQFYLSSWGDDDSADAVARKFARGYGVSLDDAWAAAAAVARASSLCADRAPTMKTDGSEAVTAPEDCLGDVLEARHVFALEADTPMAIETTYRSTWIGACGVGVTSPFEETGSIYKRPDESVGVFLAAWQAGKYHVNAGAARPDESFRAWAGSWMGSTCDGVVPYRIGGTPATLAVLEITARAGIDNWIAIEWSGAETIEFPQVWPQFGEWYACTACNESTCTQIGARYNQTLKLAPGVTWLHAVPVPGSISPIETMSAYREYR